MLIMKRGLPWGHGENLESIDEGNATSTSVIYPTISYMQPPPSLMPHRFFRVTLALALMIASATVLQHMLKCMVARATQGWLRCQTVMLSKSTLK